MAGTGSRKLDIIISGDAKGALGAFAQTEAGAGGLIGKLGGLGPAAAAGGVAVGAAAVGIGAALFKVGSDFDEQFDKIRVATGETGAAMDGLKDDFKAVVSAVPTDFGSAGDAVAKFAQGLGDSGPRVQTLSEQMLELSRITGTDLTSNVDSSLGVIKNWNLEGADMATAMDSIFKASQQSGVSFADLSSQLATNGSTFRALGFDLDDSVALLGTLGKAGVDVGAVMPAMGKAMAVAAKDGKDAGQLLQETFDKIKNAPNDTAAAGAALDVFGAKAGPKLAQLIREGKLSIEDMSAAIAGSKETILGAGEDTQDFGEKWELIKNRVLVGLEPLATGVFNAVGAAMDKLGPIITNNIIPAFQGMVTWVQTNWPAIQAAIEPVMAAIQSIIQSAVTIITVVWQNFGDNIWEFVQRVWPPMQQVIEGVMNVIQGIIKTVTSLIQGDWSGVWEGIKQVFFGVWEAIQGIVKTVLEQIRLYIGVALETIGSVIKGAWGLISGAASAAWNGIKGVITGVWDGIKSAVSGALDSIVSFVTGMPGRIRSAASGMWDGISGAFKGVINKIIGWWNGLEFKVPKVHVPGTNIDVGGFTLGTPDIPRLASGGIVRRTLGGVLANLGEGNSDEAVIPLSSSGLRPLIDGIVGRLHSDASTLRSSVGAQVIELHTHVELDGRQLGEVVTRYQADRNVRNGF